MKQPILIQGAMQIETEYLINHLYNPHFKNINGYDFYEGTMKNKYVVVSTTRVGSINSAVATIIGINEFSPQLVINQGVAGGHSTDVHVGDIVLGESVVNMNSYISDELDEFAGIHPEKWRLVTFKDGDDVKNEKIFATNDLIIYFNNILYQKLNQRIHVGTIVSGDGWNQEADRIKWFIEKVNSKCEDMESYATYKVCMDNNVPVIGIRIVSNNILNNEPYDRTLATKLQIIIEQSL